jgi:hypothetical protein
VAVMKHSLRGGAAAVATSALICGCVLAGLAPISAGVHEPQRLTCLLAFTAHVARSGCLLSKAIMPCWSAEGRARHALHGNATASFEMQYTSMFRFRSMRFSTLPYCARGAKKPHNPALPWGIRTWQYLDTAAAAWNGSTGTSAEFTASKRN